MYPYSNANNPSTRETINIPSSNFYSQQNNPQYQNKYIHNVEMKGMISGTNPKTIQIQPTNNRFVVYKNESDLLKGKVKSYPLNQLTYQHQNRFQSGKPDYLHIDTHNGKTYHIKGDNSANIANQIQNSQFAYQINQNQFQQQPINMMPKVVDYRTPIFNNQYTKTLIPANQVIFTHQTMPIIQNTSYLSSQPIYPKTFYNSPSHRQSFHIEPQNIVTDFSRYPRRKYYLNPQDWEVNFEKGSIVFVNQLKRSNQKKVITWIIKKFLTTGSFNGISYPTFVMKPQSILESYAKAIGTAPILFQNVYNPVQRMKKVICLIHSFSLLFCDTVKPFNPPLGQTFQAKIANGNYYAQQIVHHPPISAFLYEGKGYKVSGCFQMTASIGPNSAKGSFNGDLKVCFDDGIIYIGRIPCGQFSGFLIGQQKFQTFGSIYVYNNKKLVCSITNPDRRNQFIGYIGKLKSKYEEQFFEKVKEKNRFGSFPFYERYCFDTVFSEMEMSYSSRTMFDGKQYLNIHDEKYLPFIPQMIDNPKLLLKSDSRHRKDIPLRAELKFEQAQIQKQKLEQQERYYRKLRAEYDPQHHHSS